MVLPISRIMEFDSLAQGQRNINEEAIIKAKEKQ